MDVSNSNSNIPSDNITVDDSTKATPAAPSTMTDSCCAPPHKKAKQKNHHPHHPFCCDCLHAASCSKCGQAMLNRDQTRESMESLFANSSNNSSSNASTTDHRRPMVHGNGPLILSDIPASCRQTTKEAGTSVVLGIDEAGRGPVLGPMVYGMAFWREQKDDNSTIPKGFQDSKQMTPESRDRLWKELLDCPDIGFGLRVLTPCEISRHMLRTTPYSLNQMSHDATMVLIRKALLAGAPIQKCYIDTVGNPVTYQRRLEQEFPGLEFVVESKADANYAPCSAASVVAKVSRDRLLAAWQFSIPKDCLPADRVQDFGSGYPSDPKCKEWMNTIPDPLFGYCDLVRFSWAPAKQRLTDHAVAVQFRADLDEEEDNQWKQSKAMRSHFAVGNNDAGDGAIVSSQKRKRAPFFTKRKLELVSTW